MLKDYDCTIVYHLGKANKVADALSQKSFGSLAQIQIVRFPLLLELQSLRAEFSVGDSGALLATLRVRPVLVERA